VGDPHWSSLFVKDCIPWKRSMLEQFMDNCSSHAGHRLEQFTKDCIFWEGPRDLQEQGMSVRKKKQQRRCVTN